MLHKLQIMVAVLAVLGPTGGCGSDSRTGGQSVGGGADRLWVEPVRRSKGIVGRSILVCPSGDCVILHFPPAWTDTTNIKLFTESVPADLSQEIELCNDANDRWCRAGTADVASNTFNCCTFAVGDVAGLTPGDWIEPRETGDTYGTVPMQVILESFFDHVSTYKAPIADWTRLERGSALQTEDVLCFVSTRDRVPAFIHAGKIRQSHGRIQLISKLGVGPLVKSSLRATAAEYSQHTDEIRIYRAKKRRV